MSAKSVKPTGSREITGKLVLICFVGFFGIVATVNAIMVHAAVTTFAGTQTDSAYRAGLAYKTEEVAASAQEALHWQVGGQIVRAPSGEAVLTVDVKDARNLPVYGIEVTARLAHPLNAKLDRNIALSRTAAGAFRGTTDAKAGQWALTIDVTRERDRVYRTVSRVVLK